MIPYSKNITIRFGDSKRLFFRIRERVWNAETEIWEPGAYRDLTGYTVLSQVRETTEADTVLMTFTPTIGDQNDPDQLGSVWLDLTPEQTASVDRTLKKADWDVQLTTPAGDVDTYVAGKVAFTKDTSRV
jgi:hypothetical protein